MTPLITIPGWLAAMPAGFFVDYGQVEWGKLLTGAAVFASAMPALMFAINVWLFRRPGRPWNKQALPALSVLIPARNEESSIAASMAAVLHSRGVTLELVVMDDGSTDRTADIVLAAAAMDPRVRLEIAPPLPAGWNGKQHACWMLAALARYDVLCFLDADVRVGPEALFRMLSEINVVDEGRPERALVSGFPRQETRTVLEWMLLPLIHFVLLGFLPLPGERWSGRAGFAAGCGQFMMVRRGAYFASGGHASIRATMHDGLLLPQRFRSKGFRTNVYDLSRDAVCRMYHNAGEVWRGLAKNATEGMAAPSRIVVFSGLLLAGQVLPLPLGIWSQLRGNADEARLCLLALLLGYGIRIVCAWRYRQSWRGALLHPVGIFLLLVLQWYALGRKLVGKPATWKLRDYQVG